MAGRHQAEAIAIAVGISIAITISDSTHKQRGRLGRGGVTYGNHRSSLSGSTAHQPV